jgi:hypothetical protein
MYNTTWTQACMIAGLRYLSGMLRVHELSMPGTARLQTYSDRYNATEMQTSIYQMEHGVLVIVALQRSPGSQMTLTST